MSAPPPNTRAPVAYAIKRAIDVACASAALVAGGPLLLAIGAAIRLESKGGALFRQTRVGQRGRPFTMKKFRTMLSHAPMEFNADGSTRVTADDHRVTTVGRWLRGGLDELPQLLNVLRGEMSLVGPRPDLEMHAQLYSSEERRKLALRPGITSLAAVLGRNRVPWRVRLAIDLRYMDHWSLGLDAKILLQTLMLPLRWYPFTFDDLVGDLLSTASAARKP